MTMAAAASSSSSATIALCTSLAAQCKISFAGHHQNSTSIPRTLSLSKPNLGSLSKSHRLTPSSSFSFSNSRPAVLRAPKFSEPNAPVIDAPSLEAEVDAPAIEDEPDAPETEPAQMIEAAKVEPKREEVFAVVMVGGRQYIVIPGRYLYVQRLKGANVNDKITLNKVLLVGTKTSTYIGKPVVTNAAVHAVVEEQGLNPKVIVFKYKKKKNYRRNIGHRQPNTRIRITGITGYQDYPAVTLES